MDTIKTAPSSYNFVPLNKYVYIPAWWNLTTNDIPFNDSKDGSIEFTLTNLSPLFTRNGSASKNERFSAHVLVAPKKRLYFLPATSIKGMFRSALEILSFGKMEQFNDRSFGYRTFNEEENDYETYHSIIKNQKCGWIEKSGENYSLIPCKGDFDTIKITEVKKKFYSFDGKSGIGARNKAVGNKLYPIIDNNGRKYHLVCTGKMENRKERNKSKKHEYLFPVDTLAPISLMEKTEDVKEVVMKKVLRQFLSIYAQNKDATDFINETLERGKRIHVFYVTNDNNEIVAMGLSKMMKLPYANSIKDLVGKRQERKEGRDLCETIFGYISDKDKENSLKGRVQVCNAFCKDEKGMDLTIDDNRLITVPGVLGEPKPSFYPFYVEQRVSNEDYKTYEDADTIAGRKIYRIHSNGSTTKLPQGNGNSNVGTTFSAIPLGQSFKCRINFHNLRPIEIGALLFAIKLQEGSYHNIGMAKGFGYGKLKCSEIKLSLEGSVDDYIACFKAEMNRWGKEVLQKPNWNYDTRFEITSFMAIRKEHSDSQVRMIEMRKDSGDRKSNGDPIYKNEYSEVKKHFLLLAEDVDDSARQLYDSETNPTPKIKPQKRSSVPTSGNAKAYGKKKKKGAKGYWNK